MRRILICSVLFLAVGACGGKDEPSDPEETGGDYFVPNPLGGTFGGSMGGTAGGGGTRTGTGAVGASPGCVPGTGKSCMGPDGCLGSMRCQPDGRFYGDCRCISPSTGGNGGAAGALTAGNAGSITAGGAAGAPDNSGAGVTAGGAAGSTGDAAGNATVPASGTAGASG